VTSVLFSKDGEAIRNLGEVVAPLVTEKLRFLLFGLELRLPLVHLGVYFKGIND